MAKGSSGNKQTLEGQYEIELNIKTAIYRKFIIGFPVTPL